VSAIKAEEVLKNQLYSYLGDWGNFTFDVELEDIEENYYYFDIIVDDSRKPNLSFDLNIRISKYQKIEINLFDDTWDTFDIKSLFIFMYTELAKRISALSI